MLDRTTIFAFGTQFCLLWYSGTVRVVWDLETGTFRLCELESRMWQSTTSFHGCYIILRTYSLTTLL